eukprot:TRINITY_DN2723_c0_g1_i4.p1 TRINITY_DN2723_c0_g1~~TRINITY_DN2723_c0_g1_i4.p1  ORF type:complete len:147 (+),score=26.30 TRINITY_DN2723_c0_g1_i4:77-517(+)
MEYTSGKSLISRAGHYCYMKNSLLAKENEILDQIITNTKPLPHTVPMQGSRKEAAEFNEAALAKCSDDFGKAYAGEEMWGIFTLKKEGDRVSTVRETRTQMLKRAYRKNGNKAAMTPTHKPAKEMEPYKYIIYLSLIHISEPTRPY